MEIYVLCRHLTQIETVKGVAERAAKGHQSTLANYASRSKTGRLVANVLAENLSVGPTELTVPCATLALTSRATNGREVANRHSH